MGQQLQFSEESTRLTDFVTDIEAISSMIDNSQQQFLGGNNVRKFDNFDQLKAAVDRIMNEAPIVIKNAKIIADKGNEIISQANALGQRARDLYADAEAKAEQKKNETAKECDEAIITAEKEAEKKAEFIISNAKAQAQELVEEHTITQQAKAYADSITKKAQVDADDYSQRVHAEADAYNSNIRDQLNKIVREYLTKIDEEYQALERKTQEQSAQINKEHEEFINRFRGGN